MGNDTAGSLVTSLPLRNLAVTYRNNMFVADQVFPILKVASPKAKILKYLPGDWYRLSAAKRPEGAASRVNGYKTTTVSYSCEEYSEASPVTAEKRRNAKLFNSVPIRPDINAINFCMRKLAMEKESQTSSLITAGTWSDGNSGGEDVAGLWAATSTTNTFEADMDTSLATLANKGIVSDDRTEIRLLIDLATFNALKRYSVIRDQFKYVSADSVTADMLAQYINGVDRVIVANGVYNSAKETKAGTDWTASKFWEINSTKGMAFLYAYPRALDLEMMAAGAIVKQKFDSDEGGNYERIMKFNQGENHQTLYEVAELLDSVQICSDAGYLFKDTVST